MTPQVLNERLQSIPRIPQSSGQIRWALERIVDGIQEHNEANDFTDLDKRNSQAMMDSGFWVFTSEHFKKGLLEAYCCGALTDADPDRYPSGEERDFFNALFFMAWALYEPFTDMEKVNDPDVSFENTMALAKEEVCRIAQVFAIVKCGSLLRKDILDLFSFLLLAGRIEPSGEDAELVKIAQSLSRSGAR